MVFKMMLLKKLLFFTAYSLLTIGFTQVALSTKAHAATLASSSDPGIKSLYIKMSEYPTNGSNWPSRYNDGCTGSPAYPLKVFPWLGQYQDEDINDGDPLGTGNYIDEVGNCSNKYLDGGTNTTPMYTSIPGPWISPVALGGWANGGGGGWGAPVDTQAGVCPTDSDVVVRTFGDDDVKHIWGQCDIDMAKQDELLHDRIKPPYAFNNDGRHLYSNGTTLFYQTFNVTPEQYSSLVNGSYQLDFITQADDWFAVYINGVFLGGSGETATQSLLTKMDASQIKVGINSLAVQVIDKAVWVDDSDTGAHQWRDAGIAFQLNLTPSTGNSYDLVPDYGIDIATRTVNFNVNNRGEGESYSDVVGGAPNGVTVKRFVKIKGIDYVISPDVIEQKIPGKDTKFYPFAIPASVTLAPGDEVCAYISVTPAAGVTGGAVSTPEAHKGSKTSPTCATVSSKPYFRAYGNDVIVGRRFADATMSPSCNARLGNQSIRAYMTGAGAGAGVQFAASATGKITKFMSASMHSGAVGGNEIPKSDSGLTFSNSDPGNLGNDEGAYAGCMGDYKALAEDLSGGVWLGNTTINNKDDLNNNMLFVNGSLTINGNIDSPGNPLVTDYYKLSDVKINLIIVKGNIYINPNVTRIDALLVALPDSGNNNGIINTCGTSNKPDLVACKNSSLTINGAVMARKILLNRLKGDLANASNNELDSSNNIAEKFIFTPDFFLGLLNTKTTPPEVGSYKYDSISSLPPTF